MYTTSDDDDRRRAKKCEDEPLKWCKGIFCESSSFLRLRGVDKKQIWFDSEIREKKKKKVRKIWKILSSRRVVNAFSYPGCCLSAGFDVEEENATIKLIVFS